MNAKTQAKAWKAKLKEISTPVGLARHIIDFDPQDAATFGPWTLPLSAAMSPSKLSPIPWPRALAPQPLPLKPAPSPSVALPEVDILVVTWTVAEGLALSDVLTPGYSSKADWYPYQHNFKAFATNIRHGAPASESKRLGSYFLTKIGSKKVLCFKSELHMSQDGPKLPVQALWSQIIDESKASLVITTGTSGGIGSGVELGDVVIAKTVRFDCKKAFKNSAFANDTYPTTAISSSKISVATKNLFPANADKLPATTRPPTIFTKTTSSVRPLQILTTDFFGFDTTENYYDLQGLGAAVEMGDAVLGLVIDGLGSQAPQWAAVRNVSDPQIPNSGTLQDQAKQAAQIYEKYGYWTTVCSAIAVWAIVADH